MDNDNINCFLICGMITIVVCCLISWIGFNCYQEKLMFSEFAKAGLHQVSSPIAGTTCTNNIWVKQ